MFNRLRFVLLPAIVVFGFVLFYVVATLYPEILWFESFGYKEVWWIVFKAKFMVFGVAFALVYFWLSLNVGVATRIANETESSEAPRFQTPFPPLNKFLSELATRGPFESGMKMPARLYKILFRLGLLFVALLIGLSVKNWWQDIYAFLNQTAFGLEDPIFNRDLGFYFFSLPLIKHIQGILSFLVVLAIGVSGWIYFSKNILLFVFSSQTSNVRIKTHLFVLAGLFFGCLAFGVWINVFEVLYSSKGVVFGAGYADVHALLPYFKLMMSLLGFQAVLFLIWAFRPGFKVPLSFFRGYCGCGHRGWCNDSRYCSELLCCA